MIRSWRFRLFCLMVLLLLCLSATALAGGSIKPWIAEVNNPLWGPVPAERLEADLFFNNGNIISKYHKQTGVLYHTYHGNASEDSITHRTFTNVIIYPPKGAASWAPLRFQGISLSTVDPEVVTAIQNATPTEDFTLGFPYYERASDLFYKDQSATICTPRQLAKNDLCNLYAAVWFDRSGRQMRVDWVVETADDFSIPKHDVQSVVYPTYATEADVPTPVTVPSLVNPVTPNPTTFSLARYYYPSYRANADFAELLLLANNNGHINVVPNFEQSVVVYWPYPEGHEHSAKYHYELKHYLDNTREKFEILDVTPTPKGLRVVTNSFSPFEMSWEELEMTYPDGEQRPYDDRHVYDGGTKPLGFRSPASYHKHSAKINIYRAGRLVDSFEASSADPRWVTFEQGSIVVRLQPAYLKHLAQTHGNGEYTLEIVPDKTQPGVQTVSGDFTLNVSAPPQTGDAAPLALWLALTAAALCGMLTLRRRAVR